MTVTMELRELIRLAIVTGKRELAMQAKARFDSEIHTVTEYAFVNHCAPGIPNAYDQWKRILSSLRVVGIHAPGREAEWYVVDMTSPEYKIVAAFGSQEEAEAHVRQH